MDDKFMKIIERAISDAEAIKCPFPVFVNGLKLMLAELESRYDFAKDELLHNADDARGDDDDE